MQVPPYISCDFSTTATFCPLFPRTAASVLPPLPKPTISVSKCCVCMDNHLPRAQRRERLVPHCFLIWMRTPSRFSHRPLFSKLEGSIFLLTAVAGSLLTKDSEW